MKWSGSASFKAKNKMLTEQLRVAAARVCMESAKEQRNIALEGFWTYRIRMITGRSRALYAAAPGEGMLTPGATKVSYDAGYLVWPKTDAFSMGKEIPFYPWYLNFGTAKMAARPFHTAAVDAMRPKFKRRVNKALKDAIKVSTTGGRKK